ncbi:MAG: RIO1 family regulatory kinase/ATPase [Candidatus Thermoplasmatota archaeon]
MPNNPYLDASVHWRIRSGALDLHEAGYRSTADAILESGLATEVVGLISAGKEADVYLAGYRGSPIAVKSYRLYRTSHRGGGPIKQDSMGWKAAKEYEMTAQAWRGGARVPAPARRVENMFSMRYLGDEERPAPRLSDVRLEDPEGFLGAVMSGVEALAKAGVVHTDLSPYNILVHSGDPWFIDLSEALRVDRSDGSPWAMLTRATEALGGGMSALGKYFGRYGVEVESDEFVRRLVDSLDRFGVMR